MGNKYVFLDTETTGLKPGQIAQLSYIIEDNFKISKVQNLYFTVDNMDDGAFKTHHLSEEFLLEKSSGKKFKDYADLIYEDLKDGNIIAHNKSFDLKFLGAEFWRVEKNFKPENSFCTMEYYKPILNIPSKNYGIKYPKLSEVLDYYNLSYNKILKYTDSLFKEEVRGQHDSRYDTVCVYVIFNILRESRYNKTDWLDTFRK